MALVAAGASRPGYSPLGGHREHQNTEPHWVTKAQGWTELTLWVGKPGSGEQGWANPAHEKREECQFINVLFISNQGPRQAEPVARRVLEGIEPGYREWGGGVQSKIQAGLARPNE